MNLKRYIKSKISLFYYPIYKIKKHIRSIVGFFYLNLIENKGSNCVFEGSGEMYDSEKLILGEDVYIGRNFFIHAAGGVVIGDYTHISRNVTIHSRNHNYKGNKLPYDNTYINKKVKIGKYCWIGMNVSILPGVSIGDGSIIGMGSVISKDVPENSIVTGSGQVIRGARNTFETNKLIKESRFLKNYE